MRRFILSASVLLLAACDPPANPPPLEPPVPPPPQTGAAQAVNAPGLPMWVVRDADSTIYLTGTIHMLPPDLDWRSDKLESALAESDALWLELAEIADMDEFRRKSAPLIEQAATSSGPPLSQLLNERERMALNAALERAGLSGEQARRMDRMKPWYVTQTIGLAPLVSAGYESSAGIDVALAAMAKELGLPVKGLEQVEDQVRVLSGESDERQLNQLRMLLAAPPYALNASAWLSGKTFEAWTGGNPAPVAAMITLASLAGGAGSMDALLKDRNENWAAQIEEILEGSGVDFIAVGAAHLVGPDSVQARLRLRGIETERY